MGDHLKQVKSGDPLVIPAPTYNAFVEATIDLRRRQRSVSRDTQPIFRELGTIPVRNDTGQDLERFDIVGISAPIIPPEVNLDEFKNRATSVGVKPLVPDHRGRFAVLLEPVKSGAIVTACVSGVIPCRINVANATHQRADVEHQQTTLLSGHHGGAEILWKEDGTGLKWALIKVGIAEPLAITFDVKLVQVGGDQGVNGDEDCTFVYDLYDIHTNEKLNKAGPLAPIQTDIRPAKTQMIAATRGTAYWTVKNNAIVIELEEAFEEPTPRAEQVVLVDAYCGGGSSGGDGGCTTFMRRRVFYPPGTRIEEFPDLTICCCNTAPGNGGDPGGGGNGSGGNGSNGGGPGNGGGGGGNGSTSGSPSTPWSSGSVGPPCPELPPPPTLPGYYQLCVCHDGTVHWYRVSDSDCGSSSSGSDPPSSSFGSSSSFESSSRGSSSGSGSSSDSTGSSPSSSSSSSSVPNSSSGLSAPSSSHSSGSSGATSSSSAVSSTSGSSGASGTSGVSGVSGVSGGSS